MQRSIIQQHIDDFNYHASLELIREHGDAAFAERYLSMNKSSFTEKKILQHLEEWAETLPQSASFRFSEQVEEIPESPKNELSNIVKTENVNTLADLKAARNRAVAERDHLKGQLELIPTDEERKKLAERIVDLTKTILDIWDDINTLEAGKELAQETPTNELEAIFEGAGLLQLEKIRKNYVTYRSKARKGFGRKDKLPFYESVISEAERRIRDLSQ